MEKETMGIENLIEEIYHSPMNTLTKEELHKKTYMELLEIRDGVYGFDFSIQD